MSTGSPRYIGNSETGIYHDTFNLGERCNTDALHKSGAAVESHSPLDGLVPRKRIGVRGKVTNWRPCLHCERMAARKAREAVA